MKITKTNNTSFKATYMNRTEIGKFIKSRCPLYERSIASFVKINPLNESDINALKDAANYWQYRNFATNIYHAACAMRNGSKYYKDYEIYALTSQNNDFKNLDSDKLLGLVSMSKEHDGSFLIEHIQANPKHVRSIEPEFKGIGTGILNSLKLLYNKIFCYPAREDYVINFYIKNGFCKEPNCLNQYTWEKMI